MLMEEDEEYEMLEVQEDDENGTTSSHVSTNNTTNESESPNKPTRISPDKNENAMNATNNKNSSIKTEEKKIWNSAASATRSNMPQKPANTNATAAALHRKGITLRTASNKLNNNNNHNMDKTTITTKAGEKKHINTILEVGKTIQLPESIKRKLNEENTQLNPSKRSNICPRNVTSNNTQILPNTLQQGNIKQEVVNGEGEQAASAYNVITIPANGLIKTENVNSAPNSTGEETNNIIPANGFEGLDFRNEIIFDTHDTGKGTAELISLDNFDHSLPPTFFKNLCNSSRYESFGLYVANVMNRLPTRLATKLETQILRSIVNIKHDNLQQ